MYICMYVYIYVHIYTYMCMIDETKQTSATVGASREAGGGTTMPLPRCVLG